MARKKILILVGDLGSFVSNRLQIAYAAKKEGFEVHVAYGEKGRANTSHLLKNGLKLHYTNIKRGSFNPFLELISFISLYNLFKNLKPDLVHLVTIKPYLYGGIIARVTGVKAVVTAVAGLGSIFIKQDFKGKFILSLLYPLFKIAFGHFNQKIIVQNKDDKKWLIDWGVLKSSKTCLIKGSGVDLLKFSSLKEKKGLPIVCLVARLLKHKGIFEFISASKLLGQRGIKARFWLVGDIDPGNPSSLIKEDLDNIKKNTKIELKGFVKNISSILAKSHIVCLPSYREGLSLTLIEASAAGRSIVTTNTPGCRDVIIPNKTGLLVPKKNVKKLADALQFLIKNPKIRIKMGFAGRKLAEKNFEIKKIVLAHLKIYNQLL